MKYTCCERLMWHIIAPASLRHLSKQGWDAPALKKKARTIYRQMGKRTPSIGVFRGNSLHICLVTGMIWLSIFEAAEVILGRDAEEYTILYRQCGLCTLGRQEGLPHLVPYLCALDTLSIDWMGGALYRTKPLATGGDCCGFYICKKDSKWDREHKAGGSLC